MHYPTLQTKAPPVWVKGVVYEISTSGISSGQSHFFERYERQYLESLSFVATDEVSEKYLITLHLWISAINGLCLLLWNLCRGACVGLLREVTGAWPWVTGLQKAVQLQYWDIFSLMYDRKWLHPFTVKNRKCNRWSWRPTTMDTTGEWCCRSSVSQSK
jgi:hypothetical protein